ncbi:hypothetical protein SUNI508_08832 [Seiridium unicorne]|uniref:Uncharacterized protein n=1 Tax=Seiridium unicorne TaxID=138068 RepID=A0ABR2US26_9PEZI
MAWSRLGLATNVKSDELKDVQHYLPLGGKNQMYPSTASLDVFLDRRENDQQDPVAAFSETSGSARWV